MREKEYARRHYFTTPYTINSRSYMLLNQFSNINYLVTRLIYKYSNSVYQHGDEYNFTPESRSKKA
jgi:hypothetical protein